MDCTNCSAPLPPKTTRCPFCGTLNDVDLRGRVTVATRATERDCPRCRETLVAHILQTGGKSVEIDRCGRCFGLFFDPGEVDSVLDGIETRADTVDHRQLMMLVEQETPVESIDQVAYVPCPDCGQLMHRRQFGQRSGVVADTCKEHGLWLDGGELRRLIRWTQAGGRQHDAEQRAEKERLARQAAAMPATIESADSGTGSGLPGRTSKRQRKVTDTAGDVLDWLDLLDYLRDLFR